MSKSTTEASAAWLEDLKKTGAISDEEWKVLEGVITKAEVSEFVGSSVLRQQSYSKTMNELKDRYDGELAKVQTYERELASWRANTEKSVSQIQNELAQARAEQARIVQVAKSFGLDENDLGASVAPFTTPPGTPSEPAKPAFDLEALGQKFLTQERADEMGAMYTLLPAEINDIVAEHQELFGKSPKGMRQVVERAIKEQRSVRDVYEEEFKVADRRAELESQAREAEIKRRVEEELTNWRTQNPEASIPRPSSQRSPLLADRSVTEIPGAENASKDNFMSSAQAQNDSVRAAVAHWNSLSHEDI